MPEPKNNQNSGSAPSKSESANSSANSKSGKKINYDVLKQKQSAATAISDITEVWFGTKPSDLGDDLTGKDFDQIAIEELANKEVCFLGFMEREGMADKEGKPGKFLVILSTVAGRSEPVILVTGAAVVVKKLGQAFKEDSLPVAGRLVPVQSKTRKGNYWDFVSD
jgi:hypothetical protein